MSNYAPAKIWAWVSKGNRNHYWSSVPVSFRAPKYIRADLHNPWDLASAEIGSRITTLEQENAALKVELAQFQESEFHPDWSMLDATRDSPREHLNAFIDTNVELRVELLELKQENAALKERQIPEDWIRRVNALPENESSLSANARWLDTSLLEEICRHLAAIAPQETEDE